MKKYILLLPFLGLAQYLHKRMVEWDRNLLGEVEFIYHHFDTELMGCGYGHESGDTTHFAFFVPATTDPRTATDHSVFVGSCPAVAGYVDNGGRFVPVNVATYIHSHIRPGDVCELSDADIDILKNAPPIIRFSTVFCAGGDSLFFMDKNGETGAMLIPPLDSLYEKEGK